MRIVTRLAALSLLATLIATGAARAEPAPQPGATAAVQAGAAHVSGQAVGVPARTPSCRRVVCY